MLINPHFEHILILIKGAGDLASGVAYRLKRAGFPVIATEIATPSLVRRTVCYGEAVYQGNVTVDGLQAWRVDSVSDARSFAASDVIPILVDAGTRAPSQLKPVVLVDAIMAKVNTGTKLTDAPLVIALGPGFTAQQDCHAVIETHRSHWLGRVIYNGQALPNTKTPGAINGKSAGRVLRSPATGYVTPSAKIGDAITAGQLIATVNGHPVHALFDGILRGLIHSRVPVTPGFKIGDLDPRATKEHCYHISEKSLAIGGGVVEAVLASPVVKGENNR